MNYIPLNLLAMPPWLVRRLSPAAAPAEKVA